MKKKIKTFSFVLTFVFCFTCIGSFLQRVGYVYLNGIERVGFVLTVILLFIWIIWSYSAHSECKKLEKYVVIYDSSVCARYRSFCKNYNICEDGDFPSLALSNAMSEYEYAHSSNEVNP